MTDGEAAQTEQRPRLLLVDDEPALRVLLARVLDRAGYDVADAPAGEEALERFAAAPESFAAAVVDLTLPGMSGEAVVERLRESRREMAIVVTSGLAGGPRGGDGGARTLFLQKPFLPARLVEALRAALGSAPDQASSSQSSSSTAS